MANLAVTNTFVALTTIASAQVNTNFSDIVSYINNRNSASASWDQLSVAGNGAIVGTLTLTGSLISASQISNGAGSVGAPGYSFTGDLTTGMYRIGASNIGLSLGGVKYFDLSTAGALVKGTGGGDLIDLTGTTAGTVSLVFRPSTASSNAARIRGTGNTTNTDLNFLTGGSTRLTIDANGDSTFTGDVLTTDTTNYTSSSTVTGWSGTPTAAIYYRKLGKKVNVWFSITGTSNSTTTSFTLPHTSSNTTEIVSAIQAKDNGSFTTSPGYASLPANSTTVSLFKDFAGTVFTSSGTKSVLGQFSYHTA